MHHLFDFIVHTHNIFHVTDVDIDIDVDVNVRTCLMMFDRCCDGYVRKCNLCSVRCYC